MFWKVTNNLKITLKTKKEIWRGSSFGWLAPKNFGERRIHNHHGGQVRRGGREPASRGWFNPKEYIDYKWRGSSVG